MTIEEMRAEVFRHKKAFGETVTTWGDRTWVDYYTQDFPYLREPSSAILDIIEKEAGAILGGETGARARSAVQKKKWVSSSDHHGLLCHPYFYSSNIAQSDSRVRNGEDTLVVLPFGNISLSNDSFPRGFFFHNAESGLERFLFKSLKERSMPVHALAPLSRELFLKECDRMRQVPLAASSRERLFSLLDTFARDARIWSQETYSAQLTAMNHTLWHTLFGHERGELVYLEIDSVVRRLLLDTHMREETAIQKLLCAPEWREAFVELFAGVPGSHTATSGTHFFWYVDRVRGMRRALRAQGNVLETDERDVVIELSPTALSLALEKRILVPSSALILLVVHAEEGLSCAGGLSQLDYLPLMMRKWGTLLKRFGGTGMSSSETGIFAGDQVLCGIENTEGMQAHASLFDILLYADTPHALVHEALETTQIQDTIDAMIPTLHWFVTRMRPETMPATRLSSKLFL